MKQSRPLISSRRTAISSWDLRETRRSSSTAGWSHRHEISRQVNHHMQLMTVIVLMTKCP